MSASHVVIVGNTGSGKSTLARALAGRLSLPVVSSGDVARAMAERDPATRMALTQGAMAPEQAMRAEIRARLESAEATRGGWVLDGFPRTVEQLICLHQWSAAMPTFLSLELSPWACVGRLTDRAREHDNPDAVARRLAFFESHTKEVLRMAEDAGALTALDARSSAGWLVERAMEAL